MKRLLYSFIFLAFTLLADSYTYVDVPKDGGNHNYGYGFSGDSTTCQTDYNTWISYSGVVDVNNSRSSKYCTDSIASSHGIDTSLKSLFSSSKSTIYDANPICEQGQYSSSAQPGTQITWKSHYTYTDTYFCDYECKNTCPAGYYQDPSSCQCVPPCTDKPSSTAIPYPKDFGNACKSYDALTVAEKEIYPMQGGKVCDACYVEPYDVHNCTFPGLLVPNTTPQKCSNDLDGDGQTNDVDPDIDGDGILNENDGFPYDPTKFSMPCKPLANGYQPLNASYTECNAANYIQNNIIYSELVFQSCDGVCYGLPLRYETCEEVGNKEKAKCDLTKNNFKFLCNPLSDGSISIQSSECIPKENPCTTLENEYKKNCTPPKVVNGYDECVTNGMIVTSSNFTCDFPPPPTCYNMDNEVLDPTTNKCICVDGYHRNSYGNCWKNLDQNATAQQIEQDKQAQKEQAKVKRKNELDLNNSKNILDQNLQQNSKLDQLIKEANNTNIKLSNLQNQLGSDLNNTNSLLTSIKNNLDFNGSLDVSSIDNELQASNDWIDSVKLQYNDFFTNVNTQLDNIQTNFTDTKNLFSSKRTFNVPQGTNTNCINFNFHGQQITFDLCTPLQQFAPIVYFVFVLVFMISTFRFIVTHLLKGLE